ncbi:PucR family transcriptional regulator [Actinomadura sp. 6K520]|uniref:PucR family transcriptional regulator n=1 Tax=Actinomadura sp. 6K520 TaxID=2530364 RepID=UPI0010437158|nr:PucR family transcriptional regulator [Actinomadura sp. 6K520]TDE30941.1 PucR family transcriptional regulator [Actinomadura sp. 6K520]
MVTLRSLLEDDSLELRVLVPGPAGALEEPVAWVHNTELPDPSGYVRRGELVLTNGLWHDRTAASAFVSNVRRARVAGIVFGLRPERRTTPDELVAACRDAGVPLLEISTAVPFTAISEAVAARYAEERQGALVRMVRRGDALATAISRGAGTSGVLRVLRRDHDLPLAVVDRMGRLLGSAGVELDAGQRQTVATSLTRRPPPLELDLGTAGRAALYLVGAVGDVDAALICLRPVRELTRHEQDALDQAARFLSLEVAKRQAVQAIELRFASELLEMVLSGGSRAAEIPGRLRAFGVDPEGPLAVWTTAFAGPEAALPGLAEAVGEFFVSAGVPVVVAAGSQDVVSVLSWRHGERESVSLAERLAAVVAERFPGHRPVVGLGGTVQGPAGLREALVRSREVCRALRHGRNGTAVGTFAELGTHRLLLGMHDTATLRTLADGVLAPIREHDGRRGGELEATLRAFLDHDGHWQATAAALQVHVNTLRNRLTKIAELTGRDTARTADRVDLFLALRAADMA